MLYESTRGSLHKKTGAQAVIQGIAEDKGLYVPVQIPALPFALEDMADQMKKGTVGYREVAQAVIGTFFDDFTEEEMGACIAGAYDKKFTARDIVEMKEAGGAHFLELYHGKTAAFKDMALSILPYLMTTACKKEGETSKICILTATSGDTGKAALEGFADVPGTEIVVFYPCDGVSQVQERQMITQEGDNTHVFAIRGNFDDAQTGVKKIFSDDAFAAKLAARHVKLSSANSINIGRLVPQVAYYVYSYLKLAADGVLACGQPMNVVVPTGNFGNILAAYFAREMGVPIAKLICASNDNKVLYDFFRTGTYDKNREFILTTSPSMDILVSSNLERLLYLSCGRDAAKTKAMMEQLSTNGKYEITEDMKEFMKDFAAGYADMEENAKEIRKVFDDTGYLIDTHTGVAAAVYEQYKAKTGDTTKTVIASTASPYKFSRSVMEAVLGKKEDADEFALIDEMERISGVKIPQAIEEIRDAKILHNRQCKPEEMEETVKQTFSK